MRERVWRRGQTNDDDIDEPIDTFDRDIDQEEDNSDQKSLKGSIFGRLRGKKKKKEDEFDDPENTDSIKLLDDDSNFILPNISEASRQSIDDQKNITLSSKKPKGEINRPVTKDILTVMNDDDKEEFPNGLSKGSNSKVQESAKITKPDVAFTEENNEVNIGETLGGCLDDKEEPDLLANIFKQDLEVSESPLEVFVASLPYVEINELVDEVKEVKALIRQWHQNVMLK